MAASYLLFSAVIAGSSAAVVAGLHAVACSGPRGRVVLALCWVGVHALAVAAGVRQIVVVDLLVLGSAVAAASLLSAALRSPGAVVPFAIAASIADILSFSVGPTRWLLTGGSRAASRTLAYLAVSIPTPRGPTPVVGVGDLLLLGAFYLGLRRQGRGALVTGAVLVAGLLVALAVGLARRGAFGIPFMAVGVLLLSWKVPRRTPPPTRQG